MTNDEGLKPEGAPERSSKAGGGVALSGGDKKRATDDAQGKSSSRSGRSEGSPTSGWSTRASKTDAHAPRKNACRLRQQKDVRQRQRQGHIWPLSSLSLWRTYDKNDTVDFVVVCRFVVAAEMHSFLRVMPDKLSACS